MISYIFNNCYCFILYFILVAYLTVFGITIFYHGDLEKMVNLMDDQQKEIYSKIRKERLNHYLNGLAAGVVLSLPTLYLIKNTASRVCASGIVLMMTASITYYLQPKSDYMIKHLNSQEQKEAWMNVSRNFIKKKISGVMIGLFLYIGLSMMRK
tara:strand:+ start:3406 stop:3867 length:462 start_codon:yes stop_codon:yes gene_type:complete